MSMIQSTHQLREVLDKLSESLRLDPVEERVAMAEREVLRLARLLPRAPDGKMVVRMLIEASHRVLDADAALARKRKK